MNASTRHLCLATLLWAACGCAAEAPLCGDDEAGEATRTDEPTVEDTGEPAVSLGSTIAISAATDALGGTVTDEPEEPSDCSGLPSYAACTFPGAPEGGAGVCINERCVVPGCGERWCDAGAPWFGLTPETGHHEMARRGGDEPVVDDFVTLLQWQGCRAGVLGDRCGRGEPEVVHWHEAVDYCRDLVWAGYDDWALPDIHELLSIRDFGEGMNGEIFDVRQGSAPEPFFSSASASSTEAFVVSFSAGARAPVAARGKRVRQDEQVFVRCVRRGDAKPISVAQRFTTAGDDEPIVRDELTGRVWQPCVAGVAGRSCELGGALELTQQAAAAYCESLEYAGRDDFHLPGAKELFSLADQRRPVPSFDTAVFPGLSDEAAPTFLWTDSEEAGAGIAVDLFRGVIHAAPTDARLRLVCVSR